MPPIRRAHALATTTALAISVLLAACGGSDGTPDPLDTYRNQAINWQACSAELLGKDFISQENQAKYGSRLQCGLIRAPMDWSDPGKGDVQLAMLRVKSTDETQRKASLLFNPGGPGIDGLGYALNLPNVLGNSNPEDPQGALQLQLLARYDMVGFSPRGVGASTTLGCTSDAKLRYVDMSPNASGLTDATLDDALHNLKLQSEACAANTLTPYINSDATARDMDLMRHLLGDEKLHYLGYSYGTWLGAWYASLFPEKVGRMVLDSTTDFTSTLDGLGTTQAQARQRLQDQVMLPYAARHPEIANLGTDTNAMRATSRSLDPQLEVALGFMLSHLTYSHTNTENYLATWLAAREVQRLLTGPLPGNVIPDWEALDNRIEAHRFASNATMNALAQEQAQSLLQTMASMHPLRPLQSASEPAAAGFAVRCNDAPGVTDPTLWKSNLRSLAQEAPLHYMIDQIVRCIHWGGPTVTKPPIDKLKPLDLLIVQSEFDTATATPNALHFFEQLDKARMVYVPGEHQHGLFPYAVAATNDDFKCVNRNVVRYLLGESPEARTTTCQAQPKVWDAMATKSTSTGTAAFVRLEETQRMLDEFHRALRPKLPLQ
jgi:pimeloyl-ACP methyl ester carboxylesterase